MGSIISGKFSSIEIAQPFTCGQKLENLLSWTYTEAISYKDFKDHTAILIITIFLKRYTEKQVASMAVSTFFKLLYRGQAHELKNEEKQFLASYILTAQAIATLKFVEHASRNNFDTESPDVEQVYQLLKRIQEPSFGF